MKSRLPKDDQGNPIIKPKPGSRPALAVVRDVPGKQAAARPRAKAQGKAVNADGGTAKESKTSSSVLETGEAGTTSKSNDEILQLAMKCERNDSGNTDLLLALHGDDMRFLPDEGKGGKWFAWSGAGWLEGRTIVNDFIRNTVATRAAAAKRLLAAGKKEQKALGTKLAAFAVTCGNDGKMNAIRRQASYRDTIVTTGDTFDRDPSLLAFRNSVVVLGREGVSVREHRRDDFTRNVALVDYDPDATSPLWEKFLDLFLPEPDLREFVQKLAGYSLYGANPERLVIFLIGPTSTGKSTIAEMLGKALGKQLVGSFKMSLFREKQADAPRPDLLHAVSLRLIHTSETSAESKVHADELKRMSGMDTVQGRGMSSDVMRDTLPAFTPWIATNAPPTIEHADAAVMKRLVAVPFTHTVPQSVDDASWRNDFPDDQLSAVVAWAVEGWNLYKRDGLNERPLAVMEATTRLRKSLNHVDDYIHTGCELAPANRKPDGKIAEDEFTTLFSSLYSAYVDWHGRTHEDQKLLSARSFGLALDARSIAKMDVINPFKPDAARTKSKVSARLGIRLDEEVFMAIGGGQFRYKINSEVSPR